VSQTGRGYEERFVGSLYVATPAVLAHYGIGAVDPAADILTSRTDMAGLQIGGGPLRTPSTPTVQRANLPRGTSDPNALITTRALATLGLRPLPAGWLVQTAHPVTGQQVNAARQIAAAAGLTIETTSSQKSLAQLRNRATAIGLLLALGVLAMTVGLIRSETANDLRILTATGADGTTRRTLTGATAGAMALLGGVLGTAGAYAALLVWHRSDLTGLGHPPISNLAVIIVGFPLAAATAGWLLAGREPPAIARRPLE
jgi:putative ABC transport system permease protein